MGQVLRINPNDPAQLAQLILRELRILTNLASPTQSAYDAAARQVDGVAETDEDKETEQETATGSDSKEAAQTSANPTPAMTGGPATTADPNAHLGGTEDQTVTTSQATSEAPAQAQEGVAGASSATS